MNAKAAWLRALERSAAARRTHVILPGLVDEHARSQPDSPALLSDGVSFSYGELAASARRHAGWALERGVRTGDVVALLMGNGPEFVAIWLGITGVGGVVALLNTNLAGAALIHCVRSAAPRHVIAGAGFAERLAEIGAAVDAVCWLAGADDARFGRFDDAVAPGPLPVTPKPRPHDPALLIYTSGTTGLPKAARVSHARIAAWSHWFAGMMDVTATDRMYNCLPMYHSVGGVVAVGAMLVGGGSVVLRESFSARRFWDDVVRWECTLFQYIGELCRYLVNSQPHPLERAHRLRLCCGNGLRGDVWERFRERFALPAILEFYASTEGNVSLYNCEGRPGAVGRVPGFLTHRFAIALVRCDPETGAVVRDAGGRCISCGADEPGEALGRIEDGNFEGYTDPDASARKVLRDVFAPGDAWFRTGDLMRKDADGFYFFLDRLGDTFRWKGENVSTTEVADAISACAGIIDAVVFGVAVPGADGRAGMAAIVTDAEFEFAALSRHLQATLPAYARPLYLRRCRRIEATGTFKLSKTALARDGFGPNAEGEPCFAWDQAHDAYVPLMPSNPRRPS